MRRVLAGSVPLAGLKGGAMKFGDGLGIVAVLVWLSWTVGPWWLGIAILRLPSSGGCRTGGSRPRLLALSPHGLRAIEAAAWSKIADLQVKPPYPGEAHDHGA